MVDLRATGLLRAVGHDPTLVARPEPLSLEVGEGAIDVPVEVRFRADALEPPQDLSASDRGKMLENVRGADVLDVARFPLVVLRGRYAGTLEGGRLAGELVVRGAPHGVALEVRVAQETGALLATGAWEGKLTDLGIRPFKALLGALKLKDWIGLRLEARLVRG